MKDHINIPKKKKENSIEQIFVTPVSLPTPMIFIPVALTLLSASTSLFRSPLVTTTRYFSLSRRCLDSALVATDVADVMSG